MDRNQLSQLYQQRANEFQVEAERLQSQYVFYSFVRLAVFLLWIGAIIILWNSFGWIVGALSILLGLIGFAQFVFWHQRLAKNVQYHEHLSALNGWEVQALAGDFSGFGDGERFVDAGHSYAFDLDIYGPHSLFQAMNRCVSILGEERLAQFLGKAAAEEMIQQRQAAAKELAEQMEWRHHFRATGMSVEDDPADVEALLKWLHTPNVIRGQNPWRLFLFIAPIFGLLSLIGMIIYFPAWWPVALILPNAWALRQTTQTITQLHEQTGRAANLLDRYASILAVLENYQPQSEYLQQVQKRFTEGASGSRAIKQLSNIIHQLNVRYNFFAVFLNLGFLWDFIWVNQLEGWKEKYRDQLPEWFDGLAEFEALISLGNLTQNQTDWTFPTVGGTQVHGQNIGHPLIHPDKRVGNDLQLPAHGHIKLITGSNMAGKSTFLRSVGTNIVLATAGAPVCAKEFATPILQVYTSMRTQDALHENTSSFYAELKRLKFIIEAVKRQENIFFLLDEILKGTNSRDRHTGSKALIRQLIRDRGAGLVATHDLELGALAAESEGSVENWCIEVAIEDGKLRFDYLLKPGVSQSFNATILMRQMGIEIDPEDI